jgi:permuted papain-like amidase YaeF/Yiix C92 family enzyme
MLRSIRLVPYLRFAAHAALVVTQIFAAVSLLTGCANCPWTPVGNSPPAAEVLQAGDLIWPRPRNVFVPYRAALHEGSTGNPTDWDKEKERYLATLRAKPTLSPTERVRYNELQRMTYPDFVKRYFAPLPRETLEARGFAAISVGHVGIIQIENGQRVVIEAMMGKDNGVQKVAYTEWIRKRPGQLFWLGRLNNTSPEVRATVATVAESYLGRPYDFWNFDLRDESGFYCSKLAWLAITKATSIPPDGKPNGDRVFWYSPKQLLCSPNLQSIVSSGNYTLPQKR